MASYDPQTQADFDAIAQKVLDSLNGPSEPVDADEFNVALRSKGKKPTPTYVSCLIKGFA